MTTVAILGTGRMGSSMAQSLSRAGHQLVLYNRTPEKAAELAGKLHATTVNTPADAAGRADVCISMVANGAAVEELYRGPHGLIAGLREGSVAADMSTVLPETILGLEAEIRARGAGVLDAPVSGSVQLAQDGKLTIMAGGTDEDLARARPVLDALAGKVFHIGPLGSGAAMKLVVNLVIFGLNQAVSEALVLAESAGIERELAYEVLASSAVAAPYVGYKRAAFVDPDSVPPAFSLELAEKDLRLIEELARKVGASVPQSRTNLELMRQAEESQGPGADLSAIAGHLRASGSAAQKLGGRT